MSKERTRIMVGIILAVLLLTALSGCNSGKNIEAAPSDFASEPSLYAHAVSGSDDTEAWQKWQSVHDENFYVEDPQEKYFFLPSSAGMTAVDIYNSYDVDVTVNGVKIPSHKTRSVTYEPGVFCVVSVGEESYTLAMIRSNAEAAIYINNPDADGSGLDLMSYLGTDKDRSASATGAIVTPDGSIDNTGIKKIKGRGNTSWGKPKKSFNVTYEDGVVIAGMDKTKKYALVANYQDDSLVRNRFLYDLSDAVGLPYVPQSRFVDLYVNGFYWGSYLLCRKIEPGAVLPKVDEEDYLNEDGTLRDEFSFVMEINPSAGDDDYCFSTRGQTVTIISPEIDPGEAGYDEVKEYVREKFELLYDAAASSDGLSDIADIESLAKFYLINELGKNWDSGAASTFFTYMPDEDGHYRFYGSPVWDYDNSLGNATGVQDDLQTIGVTDYEEYTGWWCRYKGKTGTGNELSGNIIARISLNPEVQALLPSVWFGDFVPALRYFAGSQNDDLAASALKTRYEYFDLIQDSAGINYYSGWLLCTSPWIADHSALNRAYYDAESKKMIVEADVTNYDLIYADMYDYAADWMLSRAAWLSEQFAAY